MSGTIAPSSSQGYYVDPLFNSLVPAEGPKGVPIVVPFSGGSGPWNLDLRDLIESGKIFSIQSIYIDNSQNSAVFGFRVVVGSQQYMQIPANSQAILPVYAQKIFRANFVSTGGSDVPIILFNFPQPIAVWKVS